MFRVLYAFHVIELRLECAVEIQWVVVRRLYFTLD